MTKKQVEQSFKENILPSIDEKDRPAVRFAWNCYVDALQKDREITEHQAANWTQPSFVSR